MLRLVAVVVGHGRKCPLAFIERWSRRVNVGRDGNGRRDGRFRRRCRRLGLVLRTPLAHQLADPFEDAHGTSLRLRASRREITPRIGPKRGQQT